MPKYVACEGDDFEVKWQPRTASLGTSITSLKIDGTTGQLQRNGSPVLAGNPNIPYLGLGADASSAAVLITVTGTAVGDKVAVAFNMTDLTNVSSLFETTVTVANKVKQLTTDLSAKKVMLLVVSQS